MIVKNQSLTIICDPLMQKMEMKQVIVELEKTKQRNKSQCFSYLNGTN